MDESDEYRIDQLTEMMHHSMFRKIVIGLAEELGSDVVMRTLEKLAREGPLMDYDETNIRVRECMYGCGKGEFRKRMADEFGRDLMMFRELGGDGAAYDFLDFLELRLDKNDWTVTDEFADEYNDLMQFIEDVIENRMDSMTVFDLGIPMPEHDWGDYY